MKYDETLKTSASTIGDRANTYGTPDQCFYRIAKIASVMLDREVTPREVAVMLLCTKLGRIPERPDYEDNYVDGISYLAFAAHFSDHPQDTRKPAFNLPDLPDEFRPSAPKRPEFGARGAD